MSSDSLVSDSLDLNMGRNLSQHQLKLT